MQTFSQYATTRLLLEQPARAQVFGGVAVKTGQIQSFSGIDLVTGMPVFVYTLPEPPSAIPEVSNPAIPVVLETGFQHGAGFVVTTSASGYAPIKPTLSASRLEWLVRHSARALSDAHAGGLVHGHLEPNHFLASGEHLLIEGWGLPWGEMQPDYRAPENMISAAADVFSWARSMTMFARGNPRVMLEDQLGRLVGHCLNPRPSERPTAAELVIALEQVLRKKDMVVSNAIPATQPETAPMISREAALESVLENAPKTTVKPEPQPATAPAPELQLQATEVIATAPELEPLTETAPDNTPETTPELPHEGAPKFEAEPAVFSEPEHLAADEPDVPMPYQRIDATDTDFDAPRTPIRIGFEGNDDQSWRPVIAPPERRKLSLGLLAAIGMVLLIIFVGWLLMRSNARTNAAATPVSIPGDAQSSIVNFKVRGTSSVTGRLNVVSAPAQAKLEPGSMLASVPGPVSFPVLGTYKLQVVMPNTKPAEITVNIPGDTEVTLELPR